MNINIKDKLTSLLAWLRTYFIETKQLPYFRIYVILIPLFLLFFLVVTFPYDAIVRRNLEKMESGALRNIAVGELDVPLLGIWTAGSITANLKSGGNLSITEANLDISLLRFFAGRYLGGLQVTGGRLQTQSTLTDLNGSCNFDLKKSNQKSLPLEGTIRIILDNVLLKLGTVNLPDNMGGMSIDVPPCKITALILKAELKGSRITLREGKVSGNDLRGTVTGSIDVQGSFNNSNLDLTVSLDSDSAALAKFRPFLGSMTNAKGKIEFTVRGNMSRPKVESLQASGRSMPGESMSGSPEPADSLLPGMPGNRMPGNRPQSGSDEDDE